jgi:F0F1-type ATP synthase assembly protein I
MNDKIQKYLVYCLDVIIAICSFSFIEAVIDGYGSKAALPGGIIVSCILLKGWFLDKNFTTNINKIPFGLIIISLATILGLSAKADHRARYASETADEALEKVERVLNESHRHD